MNSHRANFGVVVTCLREALGYSQSDFARALGVAQSQISRWETGVTLPDVLEWERMKRLPLSPVKLKSFLKRR